MPNLSLILGALGGFIRIFKILGVFGILGILLGVDSLEKRKTILANRVVSQNYSINCQLY